MTNDIEKAFKSNANYYRGQNWLQRRLRSTEFEHVQYPYVYVDPFVSSACKSSLECPSSARECWYSWMHSAYTWPPLLAEWPNRRQTSPPWWGCEARSERAQRREGGPHLGQCNPPYWCHRSPEKSIYEH